MTSVSQRQDAQDQEQARAGTLEASLSCSSPTASTLIQITNGLPVSGWVVAGTEFLEPDDLDQAEPVGVRA